jgi:hypothetical protein
MTVGVQLLYHRSPTLYHYRANSVSFISPQNVSKFITLISVLFLLLLGISNVKFKLIILSTFSINCRQWQILKEELRIQKYNRDFKWNNEGNKTNWRAFLLRLLNKTATRSLYIRNKIWVMGKGGGRQREAPHMRVISGARNNLTS